ncbi:protein translocase subunit SecF [Candidatus Peregrinibacteria bacterium]|nr:MAG: protein translocase subunit SecF [Candidatus Peregrinibacteria bacterium]
MKSFSYIKYTKLWFAISGLLILAGMGGMVNNKIQTGHYLKLGIDFTGGTVMEVQFPDYNGDASTSIKEVVNGIEEGLLAQITVTDKETYLIQTKNLSDEQYESIKAGFVQNIGPNEEIRYNTIGPKIGETLKRKAFVALSIAMIAIVLYIAYAFRHIPKHVSAWRFGVCAIIALIHDVLVVLGLFALFNLEVDAFFITALLTIMGFSVHDTIVVFDRIRENLRHQGRNDTFGDVADISLRQTMSRSINTSVSTLITLAALYIWGAESIKLFTLALIAGIIVGTYSSIFIASPVLTLWQEAKRLR